MNYSHDTYNEYYESTKSFYYSDAYSTYQKSFSSCYNTAASYDTFTGFSDELYESIELNFSLRVNVNYL